MNARANLITVMLTLSLLGPSAAGAASRSIPADASLPKKQPVVHLHILRANVSVSSDWAGYVRGGSSPKVARAITAAAATRTASTCASDSLRPVAC